MQLEEKKKGEIIEEVSGSNLASHQMQHRAVIADKQKRDQILIHHEPKEEEKKAMGKKEAEIEVKSS